MRNKVYIIIFMSLMLFAISAAASGPYEKPSVGPWKGRIVDMETKKPIEGAVVLAVWERVYRTPAGPNSYFCEAKEVLTDKDGRFVIPSYKPINLLPLISFIRGPRFIIFKPAYMSLEEYLNENVIDVAVDLLKGGKMFRLAPGIIELPKLRSRAERLKNIPGGPTDVGADKLPLFYQSVNEERKNLGLKGEVGR